MQAQTLGHGAQEQAVPLLVRRYRLSPSFDVVRQKDLRTDDFQRLSSIRFGSEFASFILPNEPGLSAKAVSADMGTLLASLRSPSELPPAARVEFEKDHASLQRLVMDSVLEVESEGRFLSGVEAAVVLGVKIPNSRLHSRQSRLSIEALRYGQALHLTDGPVLAARLYLYNSMPVSPRWTRLLGSETDVRKYIGLDRSSSTRRLLDRSWKAGVAPGAPGWVIWRLRPSPPEGCRFKLYISPRCEHLGLALRASVPILTEMEIPAFKVGRDAHGVLRPDKFVVYAPTRSLLQQAQTALSTALRGLEAQGVPFTAPVDPDGLISWGIDPPQSESLSRTHTTSWRRWLTERLAVAILAAKRSSPSPGCPEPWRFALARLGLDGVDVENWLPTGAVWAPTR
jgi:hypothetical protein